MKSLTASLLILTTALMFCASTGALAQLLAGERETVIKGIPGVVSEGASWSLFWADFYTADGMLAMPDGGILFAQEQTDKIIKLNSDGSEFTYFEDMNGPGSVAIDSQGRIYAVQRTCTEPLNDELAGCNELTRVVQIAPEFRLLANSFPDGRSLGRLNDIIADNNGGAFFTSLGLYHVSRDGKVSVVADQNIFTNGLMLSRDNKTLYVTNRDRIEAFDVAADGSTSNRRVFVVFEGETFTDGITIDNEGRLYVTASGGIYVVSANGTLLGDIPTPRAPITAAISGTDGKTLFVGTMGAIGPDGKQWQTPEGIRNIAMTIYTLPLQASRFVGRPK